MLTQEHQIEYDKLLDTLSVEVKEEMQNYGKAKLFFVWSSS